MILLLILYLFQIFYNLRVQLPLITPVSGDVSESLVKIVVMLCYCFQALTLNLVRYCFELNDYLFFCFSPLFSRTNKMVF